MPNTIVIKSGKYAGKWSLMHASGFGSDGSLSQYRKIGKSGGLLRNETINLSAAQVSAL